MVTEKCLGKKEGDAFKKNVIFLSLMFIIKDHFVL